MEHSVVAERAAPGTFCILTLSCPDTVGIVHAVAAFILERQCTIVESQQFNDGETGTFFMRVRMSHAHGDRLDAGALRSDFAAVAGAWGMTWRLVDASDRQRTMILVSAYGHCLNDLLFRNSIGELNLDVVGVVSNHPDLERLTAGYGVPYHHIPVSRETKPAAEAELMDLITGSGVELVVLARYMQILSNDLCERLAGRAINIHHSMLPSFKGARPYHQAHARGVKLIGATAHYVTADLDEGPIIEQEFARVDHAMSPDDFAARGREVEARALARAVAMHSENRVALNGTRTVVLR
jgi:formyltetrahydrofolate deformylase